LKASDPETGAKFSSPDVLVNANVFINAASDTTAATLTFVLYYILANPQHWARLVHEVRSQFSSEKEISGHSTAPLPFLNAVIHETLRLRPPAPSNLQRVVPEEGMMIDGYYVPPSTVVSTPTYGIMHDPRHFSHPDDFIPTRWISNEKGEETCNRAAWIPFSYGPRSCIGKPLALIELRLVIARFVWRFDAELVEDKEPYYQDAFVVRRGALPIKIRRRELHT
jgi:cytochrome P450